MPEPQGNRRAAVLRATRAAAGLLLLAAPALAQTPQRADSSVHVVRPGDTLWGISGRYLGDPYRWPDVYRANQATVADPDRIYPSERIRVPGGSSKAPEPVAEVREPGRTVFFGASAAAEPGLSLADEVERRRVPVTEGDFRKASLLLPEGGLRPVGEIVELELATVVPMATRPQIQPFDRVYLRVASGLRPGDRLHFYRPERRVAELGRIFRSAGTGVVDAVEPGVATVRVVELFDAVRPGDWAVVSESYPAAGAAAGVSPAGPLVAGRVAALLDPHPLAHLHDEVFVDLGSDAGVSAGDELEAYTPRQAERWGVRPEIAVARLRVVRVTPTSATARVVGLQQPALEPGLPVRRVGGGS